MAGEIAATGLEYPSIPPEKQGVAQRDGAESGAVNEAAGSDLAQLVKGMDKGALVPRGRKSLR